MSEHPDIPYSVLKGIIEKNREIQRKNFMDATSLEESYYHQGCIDGVVDVLVDVFDYMKSVKDGK